LLSFISQLLLLHHRCEAENLYTFPAECPCIPHSTLLKWGIIAPSHLSATFSMRVETWRLCVPLGGKRTLTLVQALPTTVEWLQPPTQLLITLTPRQQKLSRPSLQIPPTVWRLLIIVPIKSEGLRRVNLGLIISTLMGD
jgi:hypothetical protein